MNLLNKLVQIDAKYGEEGFISREDYEKAQNFVKNSAKKYFDHLSTQAKKMGDKSSGIISDDRRLTIQRNYDNSISFISLDSISQNRHIAYIMLSDLNDDQEIGYDSKFIFDDLHVYSLKIDDPEENIYACVDFDRISNKLAKVTIFEPTENENEFKCFSIYKVGSMWGYYGANGVTTKRNKDGRFDCEKSLLELVDFRGRYSHRKNHNGILQGLRELTAKLSRRKVEKGKILSKHSLYCVFC